MNEDERVVGRLGVTAARQRLAVTRDKGFYICICGYRNISLLAVENHRTRSGPDQCDEVLRPQRYPNVGERKQ